MINRIDMTLNVCSTLQEQQQQEDHEIMPFAAGSRRGVPSDSRSPRSPNKRRPNLARLDVENLEHVGSAESPSGTPNRRALGDVTPSRNAQVEFSLQ